MMDWIVADSMSQSAAIFPPYVACLIRVKGSAGVSGLPYLAG
jgi:hypothetical protein